LSLPGQWSQFGINYGPVEPFFIQIKESLHFSEIELQFKV